MTSVQVLFRVQITKSYQYKLRITCKISPATSQSSSFQTQVIIGFLNVCREPTASHWRTHSATQRITVCETGRNCSRTMCACICVPVHRTWRTDRRLSTDTLQAAVSRDAIHYQFERLQTTSYAAEVCLSSVEYVFCLVTLSNNFFVRLFNNNRSQPGVTKDRTCAVCRFIDLYHLQVAYLICEYFVK